MSVEFAKYLDSQIDLKQQCEDNTVSMICEPWLFLTGYNGVYKALSANPRAFTHVFGITSTQRSMPENSEADYIFIECSDTPDADIAVYFEMFYKQVMSIRSYVPDARIAVHCVMGMSRSATLICSLLLLMNPVLDFKTVYYHVYSMRPFIEPNEGFMRQLRMLWRLRDGII